MSALPSRLRSYTRAALLSITLLASPVGGGAPLPALAARLDLTTVSGMSSGGAMAEQFGIAHSSIVIGLGLIAAPPYLCAAFRDGRRSDQTLFNALNVCMNPVKSGVAPPDAGVLWAEARRLAADGAIDTTAYLARQRIYAFSGARDDYVTHAVMDQTVLLHRLAGVPDAQIVYTAALQAGHAIVVDDRHAAACGRTTPPFINDCHLAQADLMLRHLYAAASPLTAPPARQLSARVQAFDQRPYAPAWAGLADTGYVYVPAACRHGGCKVHVAFHGCRQSAATVGKAFVAHAGYNAVADSNGIVVLYPQVRPNTLPFNPFACWDFWGYTLAATAGAHDFHTRAAPQVRAVRAMLARLAQAGP